MHAVISLLLQSTWKQEILLISLIYWLLRCCFTESYWRHTQGRIQELSKERAGWRARSASL